MPLLTSRPGVGRAYGHARTRRGVAPHGGSTVAREVSCDPSDADEAVEAAEAEPDLSPALSNEHCSLARYHSVFLVLSR